MLFEILREEEKQKQWSLVEAALSASMLYSSWN
jgi:hypothetical protein